jgi:hypothetical protein
MPVHPKVTAATAGASLAVIASAICDAAGLHLPVTVWPALATLAAFALGWLTSGRAAELSPGPLEIWPADAELPNPAPRSDMARDGSSFARSLRGNS